MRESYVIPFVKSWPAELREEWEERAAIMEYDGNLERAEAEENAYWLLVGRALD